MEETLGNLRFEDPFSDEEVTPLTQKAILPQHPSKGGHVPVHTEENDLMLIPCSRLRGTPESRIRMDFFGESIFKKLRIPVGPV